MTEKPEPLDYRRIAQAIEFIAQNWKAQPELVEIAAHIHLSPFHFQRLFTSWAGVSPKQFLKFLTLEFLKRKVDAGAGIAEATFSSGLSSPSRTHDLFVKVEGVTPGIYKKKGEGLQVRYGFHDSPFGKCFIAVTARGVCGLVFLEEGMEDETVDAFLRKWPFADLVHDEEYTQSHFDRVFGTAQNADGPLRVLVQGTAFQLKVWEALLRIPEGAVCTYAHIAESIGKPGAARAVGTAIGNNPIAYLIPCHRVIRKTGVIGEYRWGSTRKKAMLGWEMAQTATSSTSAE